MLIKEIRVDSTKVEFYDNFMSKDEEEKKQREKIINNIVLKILERQEE